MANIIIGDYNISVTHKPITNVLKPVDYYEKVPDLFLATYTNLDYSEIEEIIENEELTKVIIKEVYNYLTVNDETRFIRTVNKALELINSFDGVMIVALQRYYNYSLKDLLQMSSEELLTILVVELKTKNVKIESELLKKALLNFYSEDTVNDFMEQCCGMTKEQIEKEFEKEFQALQNL